MDRNRRLLLALSLLLLLLGAAATAYYVNEIKLSLAAPTDVLVVSQTNDEPRHVLSGTMAKERLDGPVLKLEIPRNEDEFLALTPRSTHRCWQMVLTIDLVFIIGYVMLFWLLPFDARGSATLWEHVGFLGFMTAAADMVENLMIFFLLAHSEGQIADRVFGTCIAILSILGAVKWLLVFLTCRALSIQLEDLKHWRWISVWLRATATGGSWAALLALVGMPARPLLTLMFYGSGVLLFIIAIQRLRDVSDEPVEPELPEPVAA